MIKRKYWLIIIMVIVYLHFPTAVSKIPRSRPAEFYGEYELGYVINTGLFLSGISISCSYNFLLKQMIYGRYNTFVRHKGLNNYPLLQKYIVGYRIEKGPWALNIRKSCFHPVVSFQADLQKIENGLIGFKPYYQEIMLNEFKISISYTW